MGVVGKNGAEDGGNSCGVPETGNEFEVKKAEGKVMAEGGSGYFVSGSGDTTAPDLLGHESGEIGVMGGLADYL